jgi:hypothetical protein
MTYLDTVLVENTKRDARMKERARIKSREKNANLQTPQCKSSQTTSIGNIQQVYQTWMKQNVHECEIVWMGTRMQKK